MTIYIYIYIYIWRNNYNHRKFDSLSGVQILDKTICISLHTNVLGHGKNPSLLLPAMSKIVR